MNIPLDQLTWWGHKVSMPMCMWNPSPRKKTKVSLSSGVPTNEQRAEVRAGLWWSWPTLTALPCPAGEQGGHLRGGRGGMKGQVPEKSTLICLKKLLAKVHPLPGNGEIPVSILCPLVITGCRGYIQFKPGEWADVDSSAERGKVPPVILSIWRMAASRLHGASCCGAVPSLCFPSVV